MRQPSAGFTLIEVLIVIAIIGILSTVVLVSLSNTRQKAEDTKLKSDASQLRTLAEIYNDDNGGSYSGYDGCVLNPNITTCAGNLYTSVTQLKNDITTVGANTFNATSSLHDVCISLTLKNGEQLCVDARGQTMQSPTAACSEATVCGS